MIFQLDLTDDLATLRYRSNGQQQAPAIIRTRGHRLEGIWHAGSPIGMLLGSQPGIEVMMTGGEFKPPTLSLTGQKAADFLRDIHVDKLFLATAGISLKSGLTYPSISDLVVKKAMIEAADTVYLVADSTKIRKTSFASLGALSLINYIVTDPSIRKEHRELFREHDIDLIIA